MEVQQRLGGRYKLLNELGSGGMAVVWKAHDEVLNRPVAIKLLAGKYAADEQSRARIRAEARAAAKLSHPNIAQVYDFGESDEGAGRLSWVVMELINGPTLEERVRQGPIPPRATFRICGEVALALAAAHAYGLVHRDIKPANVMVTAARAKVVDFGIAAVAGPGRPDEELLGTPAYLAPERLLSDRIEPASDVYALGVLIYRMLANESPWSVESTTQMLDAHVYIEPAPMPQLPGVPPAVTGLVQRCLLKDPAERPTAAEASNVLMEAADMPPELHSERPLGGPGGATGQGDKLGNAGGAGLAAAAGGAAANSANAASANPGSANAGHANAGSARLDALGPADKTDNADNVGRGGAAGKPPAIGAPDAAAAAKKRLNQRRRVAGGGIALALVAALLLWNFLPAEADGARGKQAALAPATSATPTAMATDPAAPGAQPGRGVPNGGAGQAPSAPGQAVIPGVIGSPGAAAPTTAAPTSPGATASAPPSSDAPTSSAPAEPKTKRLDSAGGTVLATCAQAKVTLSEWAPIDPYKVEKVNAGPGVTAGIVFKAKSSKIRMTVTCVAGVPTPVSLPL